jgi:hypothetical protein
MSHPSSRRAQLEGMLTENPRDVFLRYSLALEQDKDGEHDESLQALRALMAEATPYVPAFFMAAKQLLRLSRIDEACATLREGIAAAQSQNERHAASQMAEMLSNLVRARMDGSASVR